MSRGIFFGVLYGAVVMVLLAFAVAHLMHINTANHTEVASTSTDSVATGTRVETPGITEILFGETVVNSNSWQATPGDIIFRFFVALILSSLLVFRPRRYVSGFVRSLHVAETQILLSIVAAGLMLVVGDSAARAFAIFAAVALVRFRTNIRDPKEITVLLICMALGLAAGVGRWDLGVILCVFALIVLWFLERSEPELVVRPMELRLKTHDADGTRTAVEEILEEQDMESELLRLNESDDSLSSIVYRVQLKIAISTDEFSEEIMKRVGDSVEAIRWKSAKKQKGIY
ncbi:MAG: DUF4956 domain-containing protein [Acidobacteria bacterium]|nr:MAG: DUF4956 domain-containing protein [Acidobacteriota bacterium]REK01503.1 MAG: DUF4956 domain-containing protein [Acidobacteriota bacterium]REK14459.1 MAG: DUF4956 domain-containing protein [Acidobacteriota bacterium]REK45174.1 MAG: DUF4956 domain-containing protein [Acidobacteriota bacterium]